MKTLAFGIVIVLLGLVIGCRTSTIDRNSVQIGQGKKPDPKEELLGHWTTEKPKFDYYFSPTHTVIVGEVVEGEGEKRHDAAYKILRTDENENSIKIQLDIELSGGPRTTVYSFDGKGGAKVDSYTGSQLKDTYQIRYVDDKQKP